MIVLYIIALEILSIVFAIQFTEFIFYIKYKNYVRNKRKNTKRPI